MRHDDEDANADDFLKGWEVIAGDASGFTQELWAEVLAIPARKIVRYDRAGGVILLECGHQITEPSHAVGGTALSGIIERLVRTSGLSYKCRACYEAAMRDAERLIS